MFAASGKARIAFESTPAVDGAVDVLLFHAGVTDRRSWASVVERLRPQHRCVSFDARGYGETEYEPEDGWSGVADALAVLDAAGIERAVLVACSMGGATAIEFTLTHPDRVAALVLIGTAVRGAPYPEVTEEPVASLVARAEEAEEAEDWDELNRLEAWLWLDGPTAPEGRVSGAARELFLEMNGRALRAVEPGDQVRADTWDQASTITAPTLVLCGKLDLPDIKAIDEQLAAAIPGCEFQWLDGVAHLPQLEDDPACLDAVERFVDLADRRR